jgi:hypothetical protein
MGKFVFISDFQSSCNSVWMIDCVARSVDPARANERESFMHNCAIITTIIIKLLRPRNMIVKWREREEKKSARHVGVGNGGQCSSSSG